MRVISGKYKGRKLSSVKGLKVRPTSDKLKAAVFNVLFSLGVMSYIEDAEVLDLFCGSGALGIEALSRGAKSCFFIDSDIDSVNAVKKNINSLDLSKSVEILLKDYKSGLSNLNGIGKKFDLIFMDPPYKKQLTLEAINNINSYEVFSKKCIIISEHSIDEPLPDMIGYFFKETEKFYSDKVLSFYSLNQ